jgi:hypothetical protein
MTIEEQLQKVIADIEALPAAARKAIITDASWLQRHWLIGMAGCVALGLMCGYLHWWLIALVMAAALVLADFVAL